MVRPAFGLAALVAAAAMGAAAVPPDHPVASLVRAEREFSAASVAHGVRAAFLAHLSDDAVVFRPGPVNGMRAFEAQAEVPGRLEWAPEFVELSGAEDLGISIGPWEFQSSAEAPDARYGHFLTVWRRDREGAWKVALDCGVSHEKPERGPRDVEVTEGRFHAPPDTNAWRHGNLDVGAAVHHGGVGVAAGTGGFGIGIGGGGFGIGIGGYTGTYRSPLDYERDRTAHETNNLMTLDRALGWNVRKSGWEKAYAEVAAGDLRFLREGSLPAQGPAAAGEASATRTRDITWDYRGNGLSNSWDLGYVYGVAIARAKGKSRPDTSAFVHCYRMDEEGKWRMLADWEAPFSRK